MLMGLVKFLLILLNVMKSGDKRNYIQDGDYFSENFIKYKGTDFGNYTEIMKLTENFESNKISIDGAAPNCYNNHQLIGRRSTIVNTSCMVA
jgi:hypothetical protein